MRQFEHTIKDGRGTAGIEPPKSNWAKALDTPPFEAYATTCGITFTFGGLRIDSSNGQVLDVTLTPIPEGISPSLQYPIGNQTEHEVGKDHQNAVNQRLQSSAP